MGWQRDVAPAFQSVEVARVFERFPTRVRQALLRLRSRVFSRADALADVGRIEETLRWGEPAYLTHAPRSGTTIRIDSKEPESGVYAMYVHCQTNIVDTVRRAYGDRLRTEGNRAILFHVDDDIDAEMLTHCIDLALTYRVRKRREARQRTAGQRDA